MKILVIRLSSIGDVILTTPVMRCLKKQLEGCEIHYLTKVSNAPLLRGNPYIDKMIALDDNVPETLHELRKENYDLVVDLHNKIRTRHIRRKLKCRKLVYRKDTWRKLLYVILKVDLLKDRHVVDRYFDAVTPLGIVNDGDGLDCCVMDEDRIAGLPEKYVVVACGAQHETKRIPLGDLQALLSMIKVDVVLVGDNFDKHRMKDWGIKYGERVHNLCGKTTLGQLASVISEAKCVITPDTGAMHIAAAYKRPVIVVWGATSPKFGFSAYGTPHADMEVDRLVCRPCSRTGGRRCPMRHFKCMHLHNWQNVAQTANRLCDQP